MSQKSFSRKYINYTRYFRRTRSAVPSHAVKRSLAHLYEFGYIALIDIQNVKQQLSALGCVIIDELGYIPFPKSGGALGRQENSLPNRFLNPPPSI